MSNKTIPFKACNHGQQQKNIAGVPGESRVGLKTIFNFVSCFGRLKRLPYWLAFVSFVLAFFCLLFAVPWLPLLLLPFGYFALCWLANRLRDAGYPALLATTPFLLIVFTLMFLLVTSFLTLGGNGGGTGGGDWAKQLHKQSQTFGTLVPWIIGGIFVAAGLVPSRPR